MSLGDLLFWSQDYGWPWHLFFLGCKCRLVVLGAAFFLIVKHWWTSNLYRFQWIVSQFKVKIIYISTKYSRLTICVTKLHDPQHHLRVS